ncbi:MAG: hypothetical protein ACI8S7_002067, partial [Candidatus Krumholzibacteriia bacterium]
MIDYIAEIASNHNSDFERCRQLIKTAARIGCAAVNFQLFRIEQLYAPQILKASPDHRLRRRWELPSHLVPQLSACAHEHGLKFGLTPCDLNTVSEMQIHADFLTISSYELPWLDLIHQCGDTGLPLLINTGMAEAGETWTAVETALEAGCVDLTMMHCVSRYPVPQESCNLAAIGTLREMLVREFAPIYKDSELKAGWADRSVSTGVIARAVNHWGCDSVSFCLDLEGQGHNFERGHFWLPDAAEEMIAGGFLPVRRECDGSGRVAPDMNEEEERQWRADPGDGLRPSIPTRKSWPKNQPTAKRNGPQIYAVADGLGLQNLNRCLAVAEHLRDDHDCEVYFLIRGTSQQVRRLERHGFNWARFEDTSSIVAQIEFLNAVSVTPGAGVCLLDLDVSAQRVVTVLAEAGFLTVVIGEEDCPEMDLGVIPAFGWRDQDNRENLIGGNQHLLIPSDVLHARTNRPVESGTYPKIVLRFEEPDDHLLSPRVNSALRNILPGNEPITLLDEDNGLEAQLAGADVLITGQQATAHEALCLGVPVFLLNAEDAAQGSIDRLVNCGAVLDLGHH